MLNLGLLSANLAVESDLAKHKNKMQANAKKILERGIPKGENLLASQSSCWRSRSKFSFGTMDAFLPSTMIPFIAGRTLPF